METIQLTAGQYIIPTDAATRNRYKVVANKQTLELAYSIRTQGQLQPVMVSALGDGTYKIEAGFTRADAVELIRRGFEYNGKDYAPVPDFTLRAEVITPKNAVDAKLKSISENAKRNNYSPVDYMHLIADLRENVFKAKNSQTEKICELFGKDKTWVSRISSLSGLPTVALDLVHLGDENGGISYSVGNEMMKPTNGLTEEDITKLCEKPEELTIRKVLDYVEAKKAPTTGEITTGTTKGKTGEATTAGAGATTPVKVKGRTIQDVTAILAKLSYKADEKNTERVRKMALKLAQYITRDCGEENCIDKFREFATM